MTIIQHLLQLASIYFDIIAIPETKIVGQKSLITKIAFHNYSFGFPAISVA